MNTVLAGLLLHTLTAAAAPYVIAVGVNQPAGTSLPTLSFADDDAVSAASLFGALPDRTWLLTIPDANTQELHPGLLSRARPPIRAELAAVASEVVERMTEERRAGGSPVVLLWLVGHGVVVDGDQGALALADGLLTARELRETILAPLSSVAHRLHLVVDACHAAALIRSRAMASPADPAEARQHFSALEQVPFSNMGVLLSAASDQKSYEWDRMRGGVFSALVRSGLRGLADADLNGSITYVELAAFLSAAVEAIPNPSARPRVDSRPPAVDQYAPVAERAWFSGAAALRVNQGAWGRFSVEDTQGRLVATAHLEPGFEPHLWTQMTERLVAATERGRFTWEKQDVDYQLTADMEPVPVARGVVDDALRQGLLGVAFGPGYHRGFRAASAARAAAPVEAPVTTEKRPLPRQRFLLLGVVPLWGLSLAALAVGVVGAAVGAEGLWAWSATDKERPAALALARGAGGGAAAVVFALLGVVFFVAGGAVIALALR